MLKLIVPKKEYYDEKKAEFFEKPGAVLELEHSLFSLSKWESKWELPFLETKDKTTEQWLDYIEMMALTPAEDPAIYTRLSSENFKQISEYIAAKQTATWFNTPKNAPPTREIITAEIMYYWMVALSIPFECQYWHLNRLLTLVKVCNQKNAPKKKEKMTSEGLANRKKLNEARRAAANHSG